MILIWGITFLRIFFEKLLSFFFGENIYFACVDMLGFFSFFFLFKYFLKVMVSRVVGTFFPKNLVMGMCLLGLVTRCWKMTAAGRLFRVEMENMAGAVGKIDWVREIGKVIPGKQAMGLQICLGGCSM